MLTEHSARRLFRIRQSRTAISLLYTWRNGKNLRLLNTTTFSVCVFTDAQPTEAEKELWEQVNKVLMEAMSVLQDLQSYSGAGEAIRQVGFERLWYIYSVCVCIHKSTFPTSRWFHSFSTAGTTGSVPARKAVGLGTRKTFYCNCRVQCHIFTVSSIVDQMVTAPQTETHFHLLPFIFFFFLLKLDRAPYASNSLSVLSGCDSQKTRRP